MVISIICVYNNRNILEKFLLNSLKDQSFDYELILLDNTSGNFNSAAEALNFGGKNAKGKYLMFIHQDFELSSNTWLEDVENILSNLENLGVAGVAGKNSKKCISNIKEGFPPVLAGPIQITEPEEVLTIDECLIIIPKKLFNIIQFDEVCCDNWHLYASDYCLTVKKTGYKVYVLPMDGYHASSGNSFSGETYYPILKKLVKKHKNNYKTIFTTTGSWNTRIPLNVQIFFQKTYYRLGLG
jgi:hypothetical protein